MTIAQALRSGIRTLSGQQRLCFWFYGVTTIWALVVVAPAMGLLLSSLGESAWAGQMAGNFDAQWFGELSAQMDELPFLPILVAGVGVFAIAAIAHVFLLGGAIQLFCAREAFTLGGFFQGCGRNFWRFVRLAVVSAVFYGAAMAVNNQLAGLGQKIWGEGSEQTPLVYWGWGRTAVLLAMLGLIGVIFDYARIRLVAMDSRGAVRSALASARLVFANPGKTAGLYAAVWAIALAILAVYYCVSRVVAQTSVGLVIVLLAVRQGMVLAKVSTQLLFYASEAEMYASLAPAPVVEAPRVEVAEEEAAPVPDVTEPAAEG